MLAARGCATWPYWLHALGGLRALMLPLGLLLHSAISYGAVDPAARTAGSVTPTSSTPPAFAAATSTDPGVLLIALPDGITRTDVVEAAEPTRARLLEAAVDRLALAAHDGARAADVVIFVDRDGLAILPDRESRPSAGETAGSAAGPVGPGNSLSFTYFSPDEPWTAPEVATLSADLASFQPAAKTFFGDPAFANTVNVRKDPALFGGAFYTPSINEIVLTDATSPNTTCHEMIHAFRDDYVIALASYEEGMARAAEVEVFNLLPGYVHPNESHSLPIDIYYEGLERHSIGSEGGNLFGGYPTSVFLRYQLTGYAWAKALLELPSFFLDFNAELYTRAAIDPAVLSLESALLDIALGVLPTIEGQPFMAWYTGQGPLDSTPPTGFFLYQRLHEFGVDFVHRDPTGLETPQAAAVIQWAIHDYEGNLLDSGSAMTNGFGGAALSPTIPPQYKGRLRIEVEAATPEGTLRETALKPTASNEVGLFGVAEGIDFGTVTVTPLDPPGAPVVIPVVRGAFFEPTLAALRGRFQAELVDAALQPVSLRWFNKDASDYFLFFPAAVGSTPDGGPVPGDPLTLERLPGGELMLEWGASCLAGDADFVVYEGSIGDWAGHQARICTTAGATSTTLTPLPGSRYYLVAPRNVAHEGSTGDDGSGQERQPGARVCLDRLAGSCL